MLVPAFLIASILIVARHGAGDLLARESRARGCRWRRSVLYVVENPIRAGG